MTRRTKAVVGPLIYLAALILIAFVVIWFIKSPSGLLGEELLESARNIHEGFVSGASWMFSTMLMIIMFFWLLRSFLRYWFRRFSLPMTPAEARDFLEELDSDPDSDLVRVHDEDWERQQ